MGKKRLDRTVIEGGRYNYNKLERRQSHRTERTLARAYVRAVTIDPDGFDRAAVEPRPRVPRSFYDKLAPAERWLRSRVGRPWRIVEGEILRLFDTRNLAGRHVVFDHMLPRKWESTRGGWRVRRRVFFEDEDGLLAIAAPQRYRGIHAVEPGPSPCAAGAWATGRRVGVRGTRAYWFVPARVHEPGAPLRFRQDRALDAEELAIYRSLGKTARRAISVSLPRA